MSENKQKSRGRTILSFFSSVPPEKKSKTDQPKPGDDSQAEESSQAPDRPSENSENASIESESTSQGPKKCDESNQPTPKTVERHFVKKWLKDFPWLTYDEDKKVMNCSLCLKMGKKNTMTENCNNFGVSTLTRHADSSDHKASILAENAQNDFVQVIKKLTSTKEKSIILAMKVVYWLAEETMPITKYDRVLHLLSNCECPYVEGLQTSKTVNYSSDKSATDMLESIAHVIRKDLDNKLMRSPFQSLLADESTDIGVKKKLVVYSRVLDEETFTPSTHFVCNLEIEKANGKSIADALFNVLQEKHIPVEKVMGLGSDGAKVMTGRGEGVTGLMLRANPMLLNFHCLAHRLALVSSQAANEIPYLKEYQDILCSMFYFFKASANRTGQLAAVQTLLDEPNLKIKEVHEVRWLSVYLAVQTVYKCLDSLITYFNSNDKDAKSKGFAKKLTQHDFIAATYLLMDILPIISELCLVFQKSDLDIAMVQVSVDHCKSALEKLKTGEVPHGTYLEQLQNEHLTIEGGKVYFKGSHLVQGRRNIDSIKQKFIDEILKKLDERFPANESNVIYAFGVLGLRPISFLGQKELLTWGNDQLEVLVSQFGQSKSSEISGKTADPIINPEATRKEWSLVKPLVINSGYPRDKISTLWGLINTYHKEEFPNLLKLASLALTAPIHTSDCERGFSAQNLTKTNMRNRLSSSRMDDLLIVKLEGGKLDHFDFDSAFEHWKASKQRKMFHSGSC